jgi:hypothetical protein
MGYVLKETIFARGFLGSGGRLAILVQRGFYEGQSTAGASEADVKKLE